MLEIWKDIKGYEGIYQVSNLGRVKSLNFNQQKYEKILKPQKTKYGYYQVNLKGKVLLVHRLVAQSFIDNPNCEKVVNHKDGNYQNNNLDNLTYLCRSCHMKQHREKQVCKICGNPMKGLGYCNKHYLRYKKYGNPMKTKYQMD